MQGAADLPLMDRLPTNPVFGMKYKNLLFAAIVAAGMSLSGTASAELPPFDKVSEGFEKVVVVDQQNTKGLFNLWKRKKDAQLLAELPKNFAGKSYFIALTVSSGDRYAGLQSGEWVVQWRRYDERLALIAPNLTIRATGDAESKASVKRLFTDQVLLDVPIVAMGPARRSGDRYGFVADDTAERHAHSLAARFASPIRGFVTIKSAKVFPKNVEIAFEIVGSSRSFPNTALFLQRSPGGHIRIQAA